MQSGSTPKTKDQYANLVTPDVSDMTIQLEQLVQQGVLTPEQAQAALAGESEMNGITTDPALKQAQMDALGGLQEISDGGLTASDRAQLNRIRSEEETQSRGAREAILNSANARGVGGSGLALMSQMKNQQDSATRASQRDMDIAGQAQDRALQALIAGGNMGGQIQAQDFGQQAQVAGANDAISKFNAQNKQTVNLANTQANNSAQAANLGLKQDIANANVGTRNQQQQYNKNLIQQNYDNKLKKTGGSTAVANANAQAQGQNSQANANANNQTIGMGLTALAMMSDERQKEKIEEFDPSDFLDSLTGYKYEYKDKKHGAGKKLGVMAQDMEKSDIGSELVSETPEGKMIDYGKAGPAMMAALASLNKRVKGLEGGDV